MPSSRELWEGSSSVDCGECRLLVRCVVVDKRRRDHRSPLPERAPPTAGPVERLLRSASRLGAAGTVLAVLDRRSDESWLVLARVEQNAVLGRTPRSNIARPNCSAERPGKEQRRPTQATFGNRPSRNGFMVAFASLSLPFCSDVYMTRTSCLPSRSSSTCRWHRHPKTRIGPRCRR